jgi:integrase
MGCLYKRKYRYCATCGDRRLTRKADRIACESAGHKITVKVSKDWWIRYTRAGKAYAEPTGKERKSDASDILKQREGDIVAGKPVTPKIGRLTFEDAADDLIADYRTNGKRSLVVAERRVMKHLAPFFGGMKMAEISTPHIRQYSLHRQTEPSVLVRKAWTETLPDGSRVEHEERRRPASNAEINRELALLKRMFSLAVQAGKLLYRPHIPMLKERNTRTGFFEPEQLAAVLRHLPAEIAGVIRFAAITGWRVADEVLPLEWRQVDFAAGEVRLDPHTTKNDDGRVFPMTADLRGLLKEREAERDRWKLQGQIVRWVFFRDVAEGRGGPKKPQRIIGFTKAWKTACLNAGCPGRIPHDLRRTAIRALVRAGIPERVAMTMSGHRTRSVFERYNIVSDNDLREAVRKLDRVAGVTT